MRQLYWSAILMYFALILFTVSSCGDKEELKYLILIGSKDDKTKALVKSALKSHSLDGVNYMPSSESVVVFHNGESFQEFPLLKSSNVGFGMSERRLNSLKKDINLKDLKSETGEIVEVDKDLVDLFERFSSSAIGNAVLTDKAESTEISGAFEANSIDEMLDFLYPPDYVYSEEDVVNISVITSVQDFSLPPTPLPKEENTPTPDQDNDALDNTSQSTLFKARVVTQETGLNLRVRANLNSRLILEIPRNEVVSVLDESSGRYQVFNGINAKWFKVRYENTEGWAWSGYLQKTNE